MSHAEDPPLPPAEEEEMIYDVAAEEEEESLPPYPPKPAGTLLVERILAPYSVINLNQHCIPSSHSLQGLVTFLLFLDKRERLRPLPPPSHTSPLLWAFLE